MTAKRQDIKDWIKSAQAQGCTHLIIGLDPMDYENFPIYIKDGEDAAKQRCNELIRTGNRYDEVYSFTGKHTVEEQLREYRAVHFD
jgi:hypothetical protein